MQKVCYDKNVYRTFRFGAKGVFILKRTVAMLVLLLAASLLLTGCMSGDISIVPGSVDAAPDTGVIRLPLKLGNNPAPKEGVTIDKVTLDNLAYFIIENIETHEKIKLTNASISKDPKESYLIADKADCRLTILIPYQNLKPGTYQLSAANGCVVYPVQGQEDDYSAEININSKYNKTFTVIKTDVPQTGDRALPLLWGAMLLLCAIGFGWLYRRARA